MHQCRQCTDPCLAGGLGSGRTSGKGQLCYDFETQECGICPKSASTTEQDSTISDQCLDDTCKAPNHTECENMMSREKKSGDFVKKCQESCKDMCKTEPFKSMCRTTCTCGESKEQWNKDEYQKETNGKGKGKGWGKRRLLQTSPDLPTAAPTPDTPTATLQTATATTLTPTGPFYFNRSDGGCRLKNINDRGTQGTDYVQPTVSSATDCMSKCANSVECKAFEANNGQHCEIWSSTPGFVDSSAQGFECSKKIPGSAV